MRELRTFGGVAVILFASVTMAADRMPELERVVASERAFAARAQQVNARQAFVEFFAPDAVLFSPVAAAAFPRLREGPDWPLNIQWRPVAAAISGAGDMGYTAGPAEYRRAPSEPPIGYGHYTSVWQKQADGQYRVRIDVGIDHPAPQVPVADWSVPVQPPQVAPALPSRQRDVARAALRELDARTGAASSGAQAAALADDIRLHRGGRMPVIGRAAAQADLEAHGESLSWTPEAVEVAESGDFGYAYGRGRWTAQATSGEIAYLNIWQRRAGEWRLIVHVSRTIPGPPAGLARPAE